MLSNKLAILNHFWIVFCVLPSCLSQLDEWLIPCGAIYKPKNCSNANLKTLINIEDYERCAPALLEPALRDYVWGASGRETTFFENKDAYNRIWIRGRRLQRLRNYTLDTTVFGRKVAFPIGIAPSAGQELYHPEGDIGTAKAAATLGTVMIMSVFSLINLEDVAASVPPDTELWMQTQIYSNRHVTEVIVQRAERAGFKAIVVTVDELYLYDIRCNARQAFLDNYVTLTKSPNIRSSNPNDSKDKLDLSFGDLTWLVGITSLPVVVKGILTVEDALGSIAAGASAVFVSNQGGRELDDSLPTIDALVPIAKAVRSRYPGVPVFMDGGVRSGHDVFKAMARGADMVFVGRPVIWGLTIRGERGVEKILQILKAEFKNALLHAGYTNPKEIRSSSIISKWIYSDFH